MFLDQYFSEDNGRISFTREQGCDFAKGMANDFNPLHDAEAKRFCIPGDLLFSIVLAKYGINQHMEFIFSGMVTEGVALILPTAANEMSLQDAEGRDYMHVRRGGDSSSDETLIRNLSRSYIEFSGHTFPHILQPLMKAHGVMIHPTRPMVMYESMTIDLDRLDISSPELQGNRNELTVDGKRGVANLGFEFVENGEVVGRGHKRMLLSGLREYDDEVMDAAVAEFTARKDAYNP